MDVFVYLYNRSSLMFIRKTRCRPNGTTVLARRAVLAARPPTRPARPTARRQCYRRRQTTDASEQNNTGSLGEPVKIIKKTQDATILTASTCVSMQGVRNVYAANESVVARVPGAHRVPKLRHKLGKCQLALSDIQLISLINTYLCQFIRIIKF